MSDKYQPPAFLVIDPKRPAPIRAKDGEEAMSMAQEIAQDHPGKFINIYKHAMCVRTRENDDVADAG